jgi:hypothetical protein
MSGLLDEFFYISLSLLWLYIKCFVREGTFGPLPHEEGTYG